MYAYKNYFNLFVRLVTYDQMWISVTAKRKSTKTEKVIEFIAYYFIKYNIDDSGSL